MTKKTTVKAKKIDKMKVQYQQRSRFIREYVDSNEFLTDLTVETYPTFPMIRFVSMNRNGVL